MSVNKKPKIDLGELSFEFNNLDYDSDAEVKRMYSNKTKVILGQSTKDVWKKAFLRTQGYKVKDDLKLIEKTKKRKLKMKHKSMLKWKEREKMEQEKRDRKQKRRDRNIKKRIDQKKEKKIKRKLKK